MKEHLGSITRTAMATLAMLLLAVGITYAAPPVHMASGGGSVEVGGVLDTLAFTAQIDASGAVKGQAQFQLHDQDLRLHVAVDCLSVVGNEAWIGGVVTLSNDPARVGTRVTWRVQDNGEGGSATDMTSLPVPGTSGDCLQQPALAPLPLIDGNIQVK